MDEYKEFLALNVLNEERIVGSYMTAPTAEADKRPLDQLSRFE